MVRPQKVSTEIIRAANKFYSLLKKQKWRGNCAKEVIKMLQLPLSERSFYRSIGRKKCTSLAQSVEQKFSVSNFKPPLITPRHKRIIQKFVEERNAVREYTSLKDIKHRIGTAASLSTIARALRTMPDLERSAPKKTVLNGPTQQAARRVWAECNRERDWTPVTFYDEKRFTLDGPNRPRVALRSTRGPQHPRVRRHSGGGSIMLLLSISMNGFVAYQVVDGFVNADVVSDCLTDTLTTGDSLMMDNARPHLPSAKSLPESGISIVPQPPYSPDVQPVENVFAVLSRRVYSDNMQFNSKAAVTARVCHVLEEMKSTGEDVQLCQRLVQSMGRRVAKVQEVEGQIIGTC